MNSSNYTFVECWLWVFWQWIITIFPASSLWLIFLFFDWVRTKLRNKTLRYTTWKQPANQTVAYGNIKFTKNRGFCQNRVICHALVIKTQYWQTKWLIRNNTYVLKTQQKLKVPGFMTIESNVSIDDNNCWLLECLQFLVWPPSTLFVFPEQKIRKWKSSLFFKYTLHINARRWFDDVRAQKRNVSRRNANIFLW